MSTISPRSFQITAPTPTMGGCTVCMGPFCPAVTVKSPPLSFLCSAFAAMKAAGWAEEERMHFKTTAAVAALCACGFLAGCNQQQASAPPAAPAANQPAAAVPPATEQTSLTPTQGPASAADTTPAANKKF